jgi:hypothetical protein
MQQVMVKSVDVTRETAQQQQLAAAVQEGLATQLKTRQAQKSETVQDFEEVGAAAVHERQPRSGQPEGEGQADPERDEDEDEATNLSAKEAILRALPRPKVGRHVDVQA